MPEFVVLGAGPAGLFAADWISRKITPDVVAIGLTPMGSLSPTEIEGQVTTVLPIFPQRGQAFPEADFAGPDLCPVHVGTAGLPKCAADPDPLSYAARAMREFAPASLSLAWKQFGRRIWREPLLEVQRKVERSYGGGSADRPARIGYVRGESPYAHMLRQVTTRLRIIGARPELIRDHCVMLDNGIRLPYRYIVNTLPLRAITRLLRVADPGGSFAGAEFVIARIKPTSPNRLVYDLQVQTPIFRVLTPHPDIAVVQLSLSYDRASRQTLQVRLEHVLDTQVLSIYPQPFSFSLSYPLDPPSPEAMRPFDIACKANRVINLGRFAEWRYIDLHEVSWEERLQCT